MSDMITDIINKPQRRGSAGRIPDSKVEEHRKFITDKYSCPPDLHDRLVAYCDDEERAKSWVIQKALDKWLGERGY